METIRERLVRGDVLLGDGAWGTMLFSRGLKPGEPPELVNLSRPQVLEEIAALYLDAGAEVITTNTFGASPLRLKAGSLEERMEEINRRAVEAARKAVSGRAYVSASVGPTGHLLKPYGDVDEDEVYEGFARQIRALSGADMICVETMTDLAEATLAVRAAAAEAPGIPVMATMTFDETPNGFFTVMGVSIDEAAAGLAQAGADIIGSNCGQGAAAMVGIAREFAARSNLPIAIQPNAGLPEQRGGALFYPETPEFMAGKASEMLASRVRFLGGCCGTGPDHIRAFRKVLDRKVLDRNRT